MPSKQRLNHRLKQSPHIVARKVSGELLLVPIARHAGDLKAIFTANEVGGFIWNLLDGRRTLAEILERVLDEFDVERKAARRDLEEFIDQLRKVGVVVASS